MPDRPPRFVPFPAAAPTQPPGTLAPAPEPRSHPFYHTSRWRRTARLFLINHPTCKCGDKAKVADHVTPLRELPEDRWLSWEELQGLCQRCHNAKTRQGR